MMGRMSRRSDRDVELIVAFLNTKKGNDALAGRYLLKEWLVSQRVLHDQEGVTPRDVRHAAHVRASLGNLIAVQGGAALDERTIPTIESITAGTPLRISARAGAPATLDLITTGAGVKRAMAELVAALFRVGARGDLARVKACHECGGTFFDASKNRSRVWCDMSSCGSRAKARAYRRRQKGADDGA
jgi:predicted RNA-binding Zn ribbon-like protein